MERTSDSEMQSHETVLFLEVGWCSQHFSRQNVLSPSQGCRIPIFSSVGRGIGEKSMFRRTIMIFMQTTKIRPSQVRGIVWRPTQLLRNPENQFLRLTTSYLPTMRAAALALNLYFFGRDGTRPWTLPFGATHVNKPFRARIQTARPFLERFSM